MRYIIRKSSLVVTSNLVLSKDKEEIRMKVDLSSTGISISNHCLKMVMTQVHNFLREYTNVYIYIAARRPVSLI